MGNQHIAGAFRDQDGNLIGGGGNLIEMILKSVDESVANSITLQDDDELKFSIAAGEKWTVYITVYYTGKDPVDTEIPSINLKYTFDVSAGTPSLGLFTNILTLTAFAFGANAISEGRDALRVASIYVTLDNTGGSAGELRFRWAQDLSDPTPVVVKKGSTLLAWKQI